MRPMDPRTCALAALLAAGSALGQSPERSLDGWNLEPLDPSISDLGPLSLSLRRLDTDLRVPSGFEHVYDVPGDEGHLMRVSGGLYAVFPRSQYEATRRGLVPVIPSDTVFYIGPPGIAAAAVAPAPVPAIRGRVTTRVEPLMGSEALVLRTPSSDAVVPRPAGRWGMVVAADELVEATMVTDPQYRARRTRELLRRATEAAAGQ